MIKMIKSLAHAWRSVREEWAAWRDPVGYARSIGVRVGSDCRLLAQARRCFGSEPYLVKIGDHVTIARGVQFLTHDGGVWIFRDRCPDIDVFGPIEVGNNVFLGFGAILLPGVVVGDNCVIGAGAVVTRDIPAGRVAVGVPARCSKTVDDYWKSIEAKAVHIRSLSDADKRAYLLSQFGEKVPQ